MSSSRRPAVLSAAALLTVAAALAAVSPASASSSHAATGAASPADVVHLSAQIAAEAGAGRLSATGPSAAAGSPGSVGLGAGYLAAKTPFPKQNARQIRNKSAAAIKTANYFEVRGFFVAKGIRYDVDYLINAAASYQAIAWSEGLMGILRIGNTMYIEYDADLLKAKNLPAEYEGKWFVAHPGDKDYELLADLSTPARWSKWITELNLSSRAKGGTFAGVPTVRLIQPGTKGGSLYVSTTGPAYPRYVFQNDKEFQYAFVNYNKIFSLAPPANDEIISG